MKNKELLFLDIRNLSLEFFNIEKKPTICILALVDIPTNLDWLVEQVINVGGVWFISLGKFAHEIEDLIDDFVFDREPSIVTMPYESVESYDDFSFFVLNHVFRENTAHRFLVVTDSYSEYSILRSSLESAFNS